MKNMKNSLNGTGDSILEAIDNGLLIDIMPQAFVDEIEAAKIELGTDDTKQAIAYLQGN